MLSFFSSFFFSRTFHENLIACAALEESIGVREPRKLIITVYRVRKHYY